MKFINKVSHYLSLSKEKGIITQKQHKEILALIESESSNIGFMKILSIIGIVCIGIGVILIIASNWSDLGRFIKLGLSMLLPILTLIVGYYFKYKQTELKILGDACILLGAILIGATITLIGQIYHLDGTAGDLLIMWFLGALPLVFIFRLKTLTILLTSLLYGIIGYYCSEVIFDSWKHEKYILATFTISSMFLAIVPYIISKKITKNISYICVPVSLISLKILFLCLFIGTLDEHIMFLGDSYIAMLAHNILFLGCIIFVIWWSNRNHEILLRHSGFMWLGVYIISKYILLFSEYLEAGLYFISIGILIITLVYSFIKINTFLSHKN